MGANLSAGRLSVMPTTSEEDPMVDVTVLAQKLADLHESGSTVVLPTVWDTFSAKIAVEAGFSALTIGSHPVAEAIGSADGEQMDLKQYLEHSQRIIEAAGVPVSVDVESGYGLPASELIGRLLDIGAAGANIEDVVHREGKRVREAEEHADYIAAARQEADAAGVAFVINGRTDALKLGTSVFADPVAEAVTRVKLMEQAGARSVYPVALSSAEQVSELVAAVNIPVNVTAHPVNGHAVGQLAQLTELGVRRVSFGPLWQMWLAQASAPVLEQWISK